jgi:molybdenum cofactor cytidylyltransferase
MKPEKVAVIILSAGYSSRMGEFKPLLPLGGMTVLERTIRLFQSADVTDILVVVGYRADDLQPLIERWGARWVVNEHYWEDMFSSVVVGVNRLEPDREAFFLLPVDLPLVRRQTILDLLEAYRITKGKDIFLPVFMGRRGHPPLIDARYVEAVKRWTGQGGLRSFLEKYKSRTQEVEVADECVLLDLDTPSDYQDMLARYRRYEIPKVQECKVLLTKKNAVNKAVFNHCREVARVSLHLGIALNLAGCRLDLDLIAAAGLLHDVAKGKPDHAKVGAEILRALGYYGVADVVSVHHDIVVQEEAQLSAHEVVSLADKLVQEGKVVSLEARFQEKMDRYAHDPQARAGITARRATTMSIKKRVEKTLGRPLETIFTASPPWLNETEKDDLLAPAWRD